MENNLSYRETLFLAIEESKELLEDLESRARTNIKLHIADYEARHPRWARRHRMKFLKEEIARLNNRITFVQCEHIDAMNHDELVWAGIKLLEAKELKEERDKLVSDLNWAANKHLYTPSEGSKSGDGGKNWDRVTDEMIRRARDYPFEDLLRNYGWKGKRQMYVCQIHGDKNPSFHVRRKDNRGHCWGCGWKDGKYGDTIDFVMEVEGIEWKEAVRRLQ